MYSIQDGRLCLKSSGKASSLVMAQVCVMYARCEEKVITTDDQW